MVQTPQRDIFQPLLAILILAGLVALSIWVLAPFLPSLVWATMIVIATWRMMIGAQKRLWGRRWLAVLVMTLALLLVFVIPLSLAVGTLVAHVDDITGWVRSLDGSTLATPPEWIHKIPFAGEKIASTWTELARDENLTRKITPYVGDVVSWLVGHLGTLGSLTVHFLLTVVISAILFANGEAAAAGVKRFARRIGGERGENAIQLAGQAVRSVALGVVVTALAQAVMGGIGLAIAGVPFAAVLTAIMFLLAVAQIGAAPVLVGCVIWLFVRGEDGWGTAMIVWTIIVSAMVNVLRPMLIRRGADLPLLLIFAGVIGGLIGFGMIGLFVGPTVLAVTYTLTAAWVAAGLESSAEAKT
jgi:predicted PurR-regulated permease PerM